MRHRRHKEGSYGMAGFCGGYAVRAGYCGGPKGENGGVVAMPPKGPKEEERPAGPGKA